MEWRTKLGAMLGAAGLVMMAASTVVAVAPTYSINVTKTASPAAVPPSGGTVEYTVWVQVTGTGFFTVVNVDDGMAGCTLGAPTGDDGDSKLEPGETWAYTCSVTGVTPGTLNTATVNACHSAGPCTIAHDATDSDAVTVTEGEEPPATDPPTDPPATDPPDTDPPDADPTPTFDQGGAGATEPATDAEFGATVGGVGSNPLLLVIAVGLLLASLVLVTPAKPVRQR